VNRHPFDLTAFVWGIGFLVASAVVMLREWADVTPDVKWVLPAALIVAGIAGIATALRERRH
jgi:hypothetical protein